MTVLAFVALYGLGAVLMGRRFHVLTALELSDEAVATPPSRRVPSAVLVLWPVAVAVLVCADVWVRLTDRHAS
jgi:hypothetical protein